MDHQYQLELISHTVDNTLIEQRSSDGFINATAMCTAAGKLFNDYHRLKSTSEFLAELGQSTGIPAHLLVFQQNTGPNERRGTWVHPDVAIHLGQWLSPKFAVMVAKWVREWMSGTHAEAANLPYHLKRYLANQAAVPRTHFSMLQELTLALIAPLEQQGYRLPDNMIPDISEGRMFSKWLRDEKGVDTSAMPTYRHAYADGRVVDARLYPLHLLADFREHFHAVWMKERCMTYFADRDTKALPHLAAVLGANLAGVQQLTPAPVRKLAGPKKPN